MIRFLRDFLSLFIILSIVPSTAFCDPQVEVSFDRLIQKADEAIEYWDNKNADFYLARYLGLAAAYPEYKKSRDDVKGLIQKRKLYPKASLPGDLDKEFLEWFETGLDARWGSEEGRIRPKYRSVEVSSVVDTSNYFATVVMVPELESWFYTPKDGVPRPMTLLVGSASEKTLVFTGKLYPGVPPVSFSALTLKNQKHSVHYFWKPDFFDVDGDGVPELWLRYNLAWGNGFVQVLGIYRFHEQDRPTLVKEFRGENEGVACRLKNGDVELAVGFGSQSQIPHMSFDRHRVELWRYTEGKFIKVSEKIIPHLLKDAGWKNYYFSSEK